MTHGSLFSGIGGIDLGLEWAGFESKWQVENNEFCQAVLAKRFPNVQRFLDVKDVGKHNLTPVDLISGGFPCQDISIAAGGKERGLKNRSGLWYEMSRIIGELLPRWVLVENVPNLKKHGADIVVADMEEAGYSCWTSVVGTDAFQAPFQRRRVFILCHNQSYGAGGFGEEVGGQWTLSQECQGKVEKACQNWNYWKHELGAGDASPRSDAEESEIDSYARGMRTIHGVPQRVDRLRAIGNACTPVIPALIGSFIQNFEKAKSQI